MTKLRNLLLAGAVAAASLTATAAQAQYYQAPPPPGYYHHWHHGDRYWGPRHIVYHWDYYHLPPPPYGTVWVHDGPNFLLLDSYGNVVRVWGY